MNKLNMSGGGSYFNVVSLVRKFEIDTSHFTGRGWNKGLTKETNESVRKTGETYKKRIKSGEKIPSFRGRKLTKEHREKISRSHSDRSNVNGCVRTKWFEVWCPYRNESVQVQGTWEKAYAEYLNEHKINWDRSRTYKLNWKLDEEDITHVYYPDFYLPDSNEYVEIKGFMWKDELRKIDDALKMERIKACNPEKHVVLLMKQELRDLGVKI